MSIGSFLVRRLGLGLIAMFGVSVLVFLFLHLIPGDPVDQLAGGDAEPEQRQAIAECLHLDEPKLVQFGIFLGNIGNGTLGQQCPNPESRPTVMDRVIEVMPYTIELAAAGMLVAVLLALPLGVAAAVRRGTWVDTLSAFVSLSGISIPTMLMGPLFILVFFIYLGWLPGPAESDQPFALVLPAIVVGTHLMAMLSRMTRSSLVDVLGEDYMTTARAKGLPPLIVLLKHGLRNALLPVITIAGLQFGAMLSGAIITEKIFARPGLGTLLLDGINERNYPVVQGTVLVIAVIYVSVNILVDLAYGLADPRIRRA
ncbi:ABC transporter permease [Haliangium ochraceum]|uniref:Binding-protein-dependent transport systems inner membrane component n=1 Tax=Haliangium ochraceum (strain DSM 14365 / JCM 11303 / SMP-2) TaxID=502025 RepID=D0LZL0_HALO1|nr:ABC transporter permease [Haliangium ochraceum]ACY17989.1 binding-protein-dependent transport systems inner membrane component [Haliangium ochraceum DSM 14365]